jgi:hypothetical protein
LRNWEPGLTAVFQAEYDAWFVERFEENAQQLQDFYLAHEIALLADWAPGRRRARTC